jgi:zinc protease
VQEYINNYLDHEPIPGIEWEYDFVKKVLPMINTEVLNQLAATYITDDNLIVNIQAPEKKEVVLPTKDEILAAIAGMKSLDIAQPVAQAVDDQLVKKKLKAGKIKKTKYLPDLDATEWTLRNGVRVVIKNTNFKQDEIRMSAFSWGGESLVKTEDLMSAEFATSAIQFMGIGDYSATDLQKALSGKTVQCSPSLNETNEALRGSSSIKDFETLLQLIYLHLTAPRRDEEAFQTLVNIVNNQLLNKETNPKAVFSDSVQMMSTNHSPRTMLLNKESMKQVSLDKIMQIYQERFANPADFTFFFVGNIDPKDPEAQRLICTYLGSLKTQKYREHFVDNGVRAPKGRVLNYFSRKMETTTATNRIQYTSYDMPYSLKNAMNMEIIGRILSTRYLESIREREGGSYGVGTYGYFQANPVPEAGLFMQFDTDPDKQVRLMEIIHEEVQTIIDNGPLATDLQKEKESMLKDLQEDMEKNNWWISTLEIYYKLGVNRATEYKPVVEGITAETVQETLRKLVNSGNMFEVVMLPE